RARPRGDRAERPVRPVRAARRSRADAHAPRSPVRRKEVVMMRCAAAMVLAAVALAGCDRGRDPCGQGGVEARMLFRGPDDPGRVQALAVREGDRVEAGAPLFSVDEDLQQAYVNQITATMTNMQRNLERARDLLKTAAGTQKAYDDAIQA